MKGRNAEELIVKLLRVGVIVSSILITIGFIMLYVKGDTGYTNLYPKTFLEVFNGVINAEPYFIILLGLLILIITPVLRVFISIFVFLLEKDYIYVKITSLVLIILLSSFFVGLYVK
ncbi:DUF1634 domain-containing protein [Clostridium cylindrosporum]|uniref:DUF1634 domain-containing protein n=1 Tax=Clostridium cylindrosporum DSM 605 TaxID=1121307 RepID=A0A0J8D3Y2_CLOCY|nr:DUF1634 domain-containing protein [Clostridium cylindrosporum]KMT20885.1 hypothetical protein CLCY_1c01190 [Clostridium cylindrosporum DSM 605]